MSGSHLPELPGVLTADDIAVTASAIAAAQMDSGAIPWYPGGQTDPWDHVEAAMALDVAGMHSAAASAYRWLVRTQRPTGSWASRYLGAEVADPVAESNHAAYVAVGCWHHWLATGDDGFLGEVWPTVSRAMDFVLSLQSPEGTIWWAVGADGVPDRSALLTGCSSIHKAVRCGLSIAGRLGMPQPRWELAAERLRHAIQHRSSCFVDKSGFAMDWYYPVLGGVLSGTAARARLAADWERFVVPGHGVRCVADRPWVTGAETCELAIALDVAGRQDLAKDLIGMVQHLRAGDGSYWTGWVFDEGELWPLEQTTWTAAAVVLAVDAVDGRHPRSGVFRGGPPVKWGQSRTEPASVVDSSR